MIPTDCETRIILNFLNFIISLTFLNYKINFLNLSTMAKVFTVSALPSVNVKQSAV